ncbi:NAD-binding protein [Bradyrhizobium elkanii]|uniref:NAD-binding protein n=1 Tax=Bradyrhizobium elkanii TaxID=29448 RepID=UPI003B8A6D16
MAASAEAVVMGVRAVLDPERMMEVLNNGSGRLSTTLDKNSKRCTSGNIQPRIESPAQPRAPGG